MNKITRYHDICAGHRVVGHEGKCRHLHGHNYRIHFTCSASELDSVGRVVDFSVVKDTLCQWLEDNWDHKFLAWEKDPMITEFYYGLVGKAEFEHAFLFQESIVFVPFNPTAENIAKHLVEEIGPYILNGTGVTLEKVVIDETRKCSATYERNY